MPSSLIVNPIYFHVSLEQLATCGLNIVFRYRHNSTWEFGQYLENVGLYE